MPQARTRPDARRVTCCFVSKGQKETVVAAIEGLLRASWGASAPWVGWLLPPDAQVSPVI